MREEAHKSDLVDLTLFVHVKTERAIRVSETGENDKAVWLPLSQIEVERRPNGCALVTMPERLAIEKGLV